MGVELCVKICLVAFVFTLPGFQRSAASAEAQKPNFIFILADDMGYGDISPFASTKNRTPNLERMAREGMKLTSFYAAPVCSPSRAQILTGCYAKRVSIPQVLMPRSKTALNTNEWTVARLLKAVGYATMAVGKWHVGDSPAFLPTRFGFDHYFGLPYSNDMGGEVPGKNERPRRNARPPLPLVRDEQVVEIVRPKDQDRLTERYTEEAIKFITEHKDGPFFLYFPHTAVHVPLHPGANFKGRSANGAYGDWVEEVDWSVGRIMEVVRALGLSDHTLIVFSSDNGPWLTQGTNAGTAGPLRGGKGGTYEGGVREPTLAWWPGRIAAGSVSDAIAVNFDLLPTFVKLAGGTVPRETVIDGKDLSPLLFGQTQASPHQGYYYFSGNELQAVRSGPWKLAIAPQYEGHGKPPAESKINFIPRLYNLDEDLGEHTDVAAENPETVKKLQSLIAKMDSDLGKDRTGPGVREPGRIANPIGLWLPGQGPGLVDSPARLENLLLGDSLDAEDAPQIGGHAFEIGCQVETTSTQGVIVAQGGMANGYAIYLSHGALQFSVREERKLFSIHATNAVPGKFVVAAALKKDGAMILSLDDKIVATGQARGLIGIQPREDFCVGFDNGAPVGDYKKEDNKLTGSVSHLKFAVGK